MNLLILFQIFVAIFSMNIAIISSARIISFPLASIIPFPDLSARAIVSQWPQESGYIPGTGSTENIIPLYHWAPVIPIFGSGLSSPPTPPFIPRPKGRPRNKNPN